MAALQCEICGGKLMGRPGGVFECDSCGMEYDTAWAKAKIQEIKGTVKVEGTVQVAGKVKVEGPVVVDTSSIARNCVLRAMQVIKASPLRGSNTLAEVRELLNDALKQDAFCPEAHLALLLKEYWVCDIDELVSQAKSYNFDFRNNNYYENAEKYTKGTPMHDQLMDALDQLEAHRLEKTYQEAMTLMKQGDYDTAASTFGTIPGYRDANALRTQCENMEAALRAEGESAMRQYQEVFPKSHKAVFNPELAAVIRGDGTVSVFINEGTLEYKERIMQSVSSWRNVVDICICYFERTGKNTPALIGLTKTGQLLGVGVPDKYTKYFENQRDIASIKTDGHVLAMVKKSGMLMTVPLMNGMLYAYWDKERMEWLNISSFTVSGGNIYAYNQQKKLLGWTQGDYHYVKACPEGVMWIEVSKKGDPIIHTEPYCDQAKEKTRNDKGLYDVTVYKNSEPLVCKDLVDYDRSSGRYFWALEKNGNVLFGNGKMLKRIRLKAVAMYPMEKRDEIKYFLLSDGSFVMCEVKRVGYTGDIAVSTMAVPGIQAFCGLEGLVHEKEVQINYNKRLKEEQSALLTELPNIKGFFSVKRRKEIENRLMEIEKELKELN